MCFGEQNPHQLTAALKYSCFTWPVQLPLSLSWAGAVQSLLDLLAGGSRSPTSAASLHVNSNKDQEQTLSCQQRKQLPSGTQ